MPQKDEAPTFMVEDASIFYRNFTGREGLYNVAGQRNFCVRLDEETAQQMDKDGWNVKWPKPDEEGEIGTPYIACAVNFKNWPPRITMMTSRVRTTLTDDTVEVLDWANISKVDLICRGNIWNDKGDIKAYVKTMFVTIEEDYLEQKYAVNEVEE
jgi:hypothetical protein